MTTPKVWFADGRIFLRLCDGREGSLAVGSFPRLKNASAEQRQRFTLSPCGIHWKEIDEDLSFEGFFR